MSTYVTRIVQIKKDNKWATVPLMTDYDFKTHFYNGDSEKTREKYNKNGLYLSDVNKYCDNMITLRDTLRDNFGDRGWDKDCPPKPKTEEGEEFGYNFGWVTLDELCSLKDKLETKFFSDYEKLMYNDQLLRIENKLNKALNLPEEEEKDSEWIDEERNYLKQDQYWEIESISDEICWASRIADVSGGLFNFSNIRIIFYYD